LAAVIALILLALKLLAAPLKSKSRLEAENAALRHQLIVLRRKVHGRVQLNSADRLFVVQLTWGGSLSSVNYGAIAIPSLQLADPRLGPVLTTCDP
jgi:hypothetical protein